MEAAAVETVSHQPLDDPFAFPEQYSVLDAKKEALRQTERRTEAQQAFVMAADQRAIQFCAAVGIVITILAQGEAGTGGAAILRVEALVTLFAAAGLAAYSCRPVRFYSASGDSSVVSDYFYPEHAEKLLDALLTRNDAAIKKNDTQIRKNGRIFRDAMIIAAIGIAVLIFRIVLLANTEGIAK